MDFRPEIICCERQDHTQMEDIWKANCLAQQKDLLVWKVAMYEKAIAYVGKVMEEVLEDPNFSEGLVV